MLVKEKERKTLNRVVEEGIYNIKPSDYDEQDKLRDTPVIIAENEDKNKLIIT